MTLVTALSIDDREAGERMLAALLGPTPDPLGLAILMALALGGSTAYWDTSRQDDWFLVHIRAEDDIAGGLPYPMWLVVREGRHHSDPWLTVPVEAHLYLTETAANAFFTDRTTS